MLEAREGSALVQRALGVAAVVSLATACSGSPPGPAPRTRLDLPAVAAPGTSVAPGGDVCADLAYVFFLVAESRRKGATKETQVAEVRESVRNPFATDPAATEETLLHVVNLVYLVPNKTSREIEALVLESCDVGDRGQAVLKTLWPIE